MRKDFVNNPRNIGVQVNPGNSNGSAVVGSGSVDPTDLLPSGFANANGTNAQWNFNGVLTGDGGFCITIPYTCF